MKRRGQISIWLAFCILLLSGGLVSHVMAIPLILGAAHRDAWVSTLVAAPLFLLWITILYFIMKHLDGQRLTDWLERQLSPFVAWPFRIITAVMIFVLGAYTLNDTSTWAVVTYMQQTPALVIVSIGVLVSAIAACLGLRSIALTSGILLPIVILFGLFVMTANSKYKDYSLLFPIIEHGWSPVLKGAFYSITGLMEIWILLLFQHQIKSKIKLWQLLALSVLLIIMTIGPTVGSITEFGPQEAAKQRNTAFEQWKILQIGELFQHVDFMSIYQWMCGSFTRVALSLYLLPDLLNIRKPRKRYWTIAVLSFVMGAIAVYPYKDDLTLAYLSQIHFPAFFLFIVCVTALLLVTIPISIYRKKASASE
ncbi:endospore germination permease [Paenibacillus sp. NPDC058071]|uniref:GerAB/ArcD/ProY family transporter n=1 Tax=Paenibacillus sp. NPDC058071 TaxID=3346326 RepID=UPI0036DB8AA1